MQVKVEYNQILSYVTYINQTPIIQNLTLFNQGGPKLDKLEVEITWEAGLGQAWSQAGIVLEADQSLKLNFEKNPIRLKAKEFATMTEGYQTSFVVSVRQEQVVLYEQSFQVQVLAYNQWLGLHYHPALIAAFVTPNAPAVANIVSKASQILSTWDLTFTGYQTQDKNDVRAQMKAIYLALEAEQISYISAPPSFEPVGQRIRLAEDVVAYRLGNCIEMALLYGACLEYVGLNPLIIILPGHAFAGCWLEDLTFQRSIDDDNSALSKRLAKGMQTIELVETTLLTNRPVQTYEAAVTYGQDQILDGQAFEYVLDVGKARSLGIRPLPQKLEVETLQVGENQDFDLDRIGVGKPPENLETGDPIEIITRQKRSRLQVWESKLLNLTLRNNLLNFRPTRRTIPILEGDLNLLEDHLSSGQEFSLVACPPEIEAERRKDKEYSYTRALKDEYRTYMNMEMKSNRLVSLLGEEDLDFAIKALYYSSRTELEENGANTLFVAMGFLKWYENDLSKLGRYAPILLFPIEMIRRSSIKGYLIRYREEEVQVNTTLLEKLRMELNLEFPGLVPLPEDESGIDIQKVMNTIRTGVLDKKGWDVIEVSYIGLFSFNQFVMWNDIHSRSQELMENPIVSSLMQGKMDFQTPPIIDGSQIDNTDLFFNNAVLMAADSSQLEAVYSASLGSSFVLHGPPGTGKSQTITNIIASALYNNKSVLFVAEKMAALNVVQTRLEKVGIGDFALEVHSNKAKKGEVLAKIESVLAKQKNGKIKEIKEKRASLNQVRDEIKLTNQALHKIRDNGYSLYQMIGMFEQAGGQPTYPVGDLAKNLRKEKVDQIRQGIGKLLALFTDVEPVGANPLAFITNTQISFKAREELRALIQRLDTALDQLDQKQEEFSRFLAQGISLASLGQFAQVVHLMVGGQDLLWPYILSYARKEIDAGLKVMVTKGKQAQGLALAIGSEFQAGVLDLDSKTLLLEWNQSSREWFLAKWLKQKRLLKNLKAYALAPANLNKENIKLKLEALAEYQALSQEINTYMTRQEGLESLWQGDKTDWDRLAAAVELTDRVSGLLRMLGRENSGINIPAWLASVHGDWLVYQQDKEGVAQDLFALATEVNHYQDQIRDLAGGPVAGPDTSVGTVRNKLARVLAAYSGLDAWIAYIGSRQVLYDLGLEDFVHRLEKGQIPAQDFLATTIKSLVYYGLVEILEEEPQLANFHHHNFEYLLDQYRKELDLVTEMTRLELIEKLVANLPHPIGDININSELGILKKAIKNKARGLSLRKLFDMTPHVLRKIAPCMLMSPISIAQYIDPAFPKFDLVIFDEASQVNTHSAVGAIARGKQLIVVGDPNQLPPTSFFKGNFEEEDIEFEEVDQDSILDECQAIMLPELHLKWHYRSKHESLIAFSNSQYYENKLYTFPAYNDLESKVRLIPVEGYYDRSGTKENLAEAEAIIEEIKTRLQSPRLRQQTLGVVTFSSVQQKLIQVKLDQVFAAYPELEEAAQGLREEIFIKNLENVQGDERDVILFSVGYGPDRNGKVTMNFGPLNQSQGWKRLNVVVSRSREEMLVYSTLKPEQIDLSRTDALGVAGLKGFLEFARNKNSLAVDLQAIQFVKDDLIDAVAHTLEQEGYQVVKRVGKSNYRIDIGVVNPAQPNQFMAAVIVDGIQYYQTPTVRDKVVVQPFMLNRLQWNIIRVWAIDWFKNKAGVINMVKQALEEIRQKQRQELAESEVPVENLAKAFKIEYVQTPDKVQAFYQAYPLEENRFDKEEFYLVRSLAQITEIMQAIIDFEAPVVEDDLFRRVLSVWGINQVGKRLQEILVEAASQVKAVRILDDQQNTYWKSQADYEKGPIARRFKQDKRKFHHICDDEIMATILEVLRQQVSLDFKNLCKEVFKFHGYNMLGEEAQNTVYALLDLLINKNKVLAEDGRYLKI